jgi:site-specific DNA recombinase
MAPYGYDREILGPDGKVLYRVRFGEGGVREVFDKAGRFQARYQKGQSLRKPGKECKSRLVPSDPARVRVVRDIYRLCIEGWGFKTIAEHLNNKGLPSPLGDLWSFTAVKALIENPVYRGDIVWNRRTQSKFYGVRGGRADTMKRSDESARVVHLPEDDWVVLRDRIPALVDRQTWEKAQTMVARRRNLRGGAGRSTNRWLLSSVLVCGDCGHPFWGENKRKGRVPGRRDVFTKYYTCAGRRTHGRHVCAAPSHVMAEPLEKWVLGKLADLVFADARGVEAAVDRFVAAVLGAPGKRPGTAAIERQIKEVDATVRAITVSIDPANLALLNDRLTQLRQRREQLEQELAAAQACGAHLDEAALREWARQRIVGLADAMNGRRDQKVREVLASYVERIVVTPSSKTGIMAVNAGACGGPATDDACGRKKNDRPEGRSWVNVVAGAGFDTDSQSSWDWEDIELAGAAPVAG